LVLATAAAVAVVARGIEPRLGIAAAFVLGAILASTDPVAVTALSRHLRLPPRLATVVQTESLFNDATSLVLFQVAVVAVTTAHVTALDALGRFGVLGGGGLLVGLLVGAAGGVVIQRAHVPIVQAGLAVAIPYAAAVAANLARVSPVTAVIVAGLMLARRHPRAAPEAGRRLAESVYAVIVFVFESVVFALIGLQLAGFLRDLSPSERGTALALVAAVTGVLLAVRAATLAAAVGTSRARGRGRGSAREQWAAAAVATWAGARGVVPLAAVLAIPTRTHAGHAVAHRPLLAAVATAVVVVTLVVQGTTLAPLVRRLGVAQQADA
jgi:CPA1 family monovalent cation:H+ antiporter